MGHRHSSAPLRGAGAFCAARSGPAGLAPEPRPLEGWGKGAEVCLPESRSDRGPGSASLNASHKLPLGGRLSRATVWVLLGCLRFYQAVFSSLMPVGCKFYPSCSHYAHEAIARHGALRGLRLATGRLLRCSPFTRGGYDPVPEPQDGSIHEVGA